MEELGEIRHPLRQAHGRLWVGILAPLCSLGVEGAKAWEKPRGRPTITTSVRGEDRNLKHGGTQGTREKTAEGFGCLRIRMINWWDGHSDKKQNVGSAVNLQDESGISGCRCVDRQ